MMTPIHTFSEREMSEIKLALLYADRCAHGTPGHNRLMLLARLADIVGIDYDVEIDFWTLPDNVLVLDEDGEPVDLNDH